MNQKCFQFFALSRAWDKEKNLSPHEESNVRPSDPSLNTLLLSRRDSMVSAGHYKVHI